MTKLELRSSNLLGIFFNEMDCIVNILEFVDLMICLTTI